MADEGMTKFFSSEIEEHLVRRYNTGYKRAGHEKINMREKVIWGLLDLVGDEDDIVDDSLKIFEILINSNILRYYNLRTV